MDEHTISPAGDPFYAAAHHGQDEHPHGFLNEYVYIGHMVEGDDGQEVEVYTTVPCRRCEG